MLRTNPFYDTVIRRYASDEGAITSRPSLLALFDPATVTKCALDCLMSVCPGLNITCVCTSVDEKGWIVKCLEASCGRRDAIISRRQIAERCDTRVRNRATEFILMNILLGAVAVTVMLIRLVYKRFYSDRRQLTVDDWFVFTILLTAAPSIVINVFGLALNGLGKDSWGISLSKLEIFHLYFYAMGFLYLILLTLIKLTLSLFYLTIFPGTLVRRMLWGTAVFQVLFGVSFAFKHIFQCSPMRYYWAEFGEQVRDSYCINSNAAGYANAAISIAADLWLIGIPLAQIGKMRLHWKKKAAAAVMFLAGTLFTLVSIIRLHSLVYLGNPSNPTWDLWEVLWWSTIEINIGIICTCLPSIRLLLVRIWPKMFGPDLSPDNVTPNIETIALTTVRTHTGRSEQHTVESNDKRKREL